MDRKEGQKSLLGERLNKKYKAGMLVFVKEWYQFCIRKKEEAGKKLILQIAGLEARDRIRKVAGMRIDQGMNKLGIFRLRISCISSVVDKETGGILDAKDAHGSCYFKQQSSVRFSTIVYGIFK